MRQPKFDFNFAVMHHHTELISEDIGNSNLSSAKLTYLWKMIKDRIKNKLNFKFIHKTINYFNSL